MSDDLLSYNGFYDKKIAPTVRKGGDANHTVPVWRTGADIHYDWSHKYFDNNFKVLKVRNLSLQNSPSIPP